MKRKLIVTYDDTEVNACQALLYAKSAAAQGYISEAAGIKHFCWMTTFGSDGVNVSARRKSSAAAADSLHVWTTKEVIERT